VQNSIAKCTACPLSRTRTRAVPGVGDAEAKIVFIGEAPGWNEDKQGIPFIGKAGQLLDQLLANVQITREETYIMNVVNCKPPNNRDPKRDELKECKNWINSQLACLPKHKIIVALGRYASLALCPTQKPADVRNTARWVDGKIHLFLFHPAAALHNPNQMPELERGFKLLKELVA